MKRTFTGTFDQCMAIIRKSEKLNRSRKYGKNSGYSQYDLEPVEGEERKKIKSDWIHHNFMIYKRGSQVFDKVDCFYVLTLHR